LIRKEKSRLSTGEGDAYQYYQFEKLPSTGIRAAAPKSSGAGEAPGNPPGGLKGIGHALLTGASKSLTQSANTRIQR
jgi:hypothetical protein